MKGLHGSLGPYDPGMNGMGLFRGRDNGMAVPWLGR